MDPLIVACLVVIFGLVVGGVLVTRARKRRD